jgi:hypothetical protein
MLGKCGICGSELTIQNSESFAESQQVRDRHVPSNCAQVLYAKLGEAMAEVKETREVLEEIADMTTDAVVCKMVKEYLANCAAAGQKK